MGRLNASMRNNNYRNIRTEQWQSLFTLVTQYVRRKYVAWLTKQWLRKRLASMQIFFSFTVSKSNITKSPFNSWLFSWLGRNWFPPFSFVPRHKWWSPRVSSWRAKWECERLSTNDFGESSPHVMPNLLASWIYLNSSFIVKVFLDIGHSVKNCMQAISRDPEYSK